MTTRQRLGMGLRAALTGTTLALCLAASARADQPALPSDRPQPVRVAEVALQPLTRDVTYTGSIRPRYSSILSFRIDGKMTERMIEVGQRVTTGQPLARLDETDIRLGVASLQAEEAAARSSLDRLDTELKRQQALRVKGFVAQSVLDQTVTQRDEAQARLDQAGRSLDRNRNQLRYTTLVADHAGIVTSTSAEAGQVLETGAPVLTLARTDALDAVIALPEQKRDGLEALTASVTLWDGAAQPYAATLREVSPDVDPASRTYTVRFTIDAPDAALSLGRTITLRLQAPPGPVVTALPLAAVMNDGRGAAVWKLTPDGMGVIRQPVAVQALTDDTALISDGLQAGDRVVSLGVHKIDPGRPVRIVEETAPLALN